MSWEKALENGKDLLATLAMWHVWATVGTVLVVGSIGLEFLDYRVGVSQTAENRAFYGGLFCLGVATFLLWVKRIQENKNGD